jgi:addiction module HigA family antidote
MVRIPTYRPPTHPGEMLQDEFLIPMNISQRDLAKAIHVPYRLINELVNQKGGVTPSPALRLAKFFGVSTDLCLNLQIRWDLFNPRKAERDSGSAGRLLSIGGSPYGIRPTPTKLLRYDPNASKR